MKKGGRKGRVGVRKRVRRRIVVLDVLCTINVGPRADTSTIFSMKMPLLVKGFRLRLLLLPMECVDVISLILVTLIALGRLPTRQENPL